jgi:PKD repeat protein
MTAPLRQPAVGLVLGACLLFVCGGQARATAPRSHTVNARVSATFVMHGRVTRALRVAGEHRGETVIRTWTFTGQACTRTYCRRLQLRRERSAQLFDTLVLTRVGVGRYRGASRFFEALECNGALFPRGEVVPYRITVRVTRARTIQGIPFASALSADYANLRRSDRTICPIGPSHDSAVYGGTASPLPTPPAAAFTATVDGPTDRVAVTDGSVPGAGGAPIVARSWQFGDPASGAANTATTPGAAHTFTAPGTYTVSLTVTDANGLSSTRTQSVVAPGPPTAAFTAAGVGQTLTDAFADGSAPGIGGAPVTAWLWTFGDAPSGAANSSAAQNPQHTFSAPGSYPVCLLIADADGRHAADCANVVVAPAATPARQLSKRTVASTAESSPTSRAGRLRTGAITA